MNQRRGFLAGMVAIGMSLGLMSQDRGPHTLMGTRRRKPSRFDDKNYIGNIDNPAKVIPAGCKEYEFFGFKVIALSEKRAQAKAMKMYNDSRK